MSRSKGQSNTLVNSIDYRGYTIEIHYEEYSGDMNPREMYSNLGKILIFDDRQFSDSGITNWSREEFFEEVVKEEDLFYIPIRFYADSACATVYTTDDEDRANGVIYVSLETVMKEYSLASIDAARMYCDTFDDHVYEPTHEGDPSKIRFGSVRKILEHELKTWKEWLNGEVYGYVVYGPNEDEPFDDAGASCWGFIGDDDQGYAVNEAKLWIDWHIEDQTHEEEMASRYMAL